jgi:hypothetical protein
MYNRQRYRILSKTKSKSLISRREEQNACSCSAQVQPRYAPEKITRDGNRSFDQKQRITLKSSTKERKSKSINKGERRIRDLEKRIVGHIGTQSRHGKLMYQHALRPSQKQSQAVAAVIRFPKAMKQSSFVVWFAFLPPIAPAV